MSRRDDRERLLVEADRLMEDGDPRGELIRVQIDRENHDSETLRQRDVELRAQIVGQPPDDVSLEWQRGFVVELAVVSPARVREVVSWLRSFRTSGVFRSVDVVIDNVADPVPLVGVLPPQARQVQLHPWRPGTMGSAPEVRGLEALSGGALELLSIQAHAIVVPPLDLPELTELKLVALREVDLDGLVSSLLPVLQRLVVEGVSLDERDIDGLLRVPALLRGAKLVLDGNQLGADEVRRLQDGLPAVDVGDQTWSYTEEEEDEEAFEDDDELDDDDDLDDEEEDEE